MHSLVNFNKGSTTALCVEIGNPVYKNMMEIEGTTVDLYCTWEKTGKVMNISEIEKNGSKHNP